MGVIDWLTVIAYFVVMIILGFWVVKRIDGSKDYYVAGGKVPWWLAGISHHVSGYSGAVFVAYAGIAYSSGFNIYVWWAIPITIAVFSGAYIMAPRWARLRKVLDIESPTEYLSRRYNLATQQLIAWCGIVLKLFDVGAKWAAIGILLNVFTGVSIFYGIIFSGVVSLIYITIGGLWADLVTDFVQFLITLVVSVVLFFIVFLDFGGFSSFSNVFNQLPDSHSDLFVEPYGMAYVFIYMFIVFLSYNGGTWNLATRYISAPNANQAKKSALLSGSLYLIFPLIIFFPLWASPLIIGEIQDPTKSYALLVQELLPAGMIGLVVASLFAATMSMTSSDANTISAVITKDVLPTISKKFTNLDQKKTLTIGRIVTVIFTLLTLIVAAFYENFGGVIGLLITWFAALVGPIAIPMLLGLFKVFKHSNSTAAIASIIVGLTAFTFTKFTSGYPLYFTTGLPVFCSFIVYVGIGLLNKNNPVSTEVETLLEGISDTSKDNEV